MPKPETWQYDPACYPFSTIVETRFQDLDPLGHINNVAMAAIFENGRVRFNRQTGLFDAHAPGDRWLIARVVIDYVAEAHFPEPVVVASGIVRVGTSSWDIASAAFQRGTCVAISGTTLVQTNAQGSYPLSDQRRAAFEAVMVRKAAGNSGT